MSDDLVDSLAADAMAAAIAESRSPSSFTYVIFDLDGSLLDYEGQSHVALCEGLRGAGLGLDGSDAVSWELHASIIGMRPEGWSKQILTALKVPAETFTPE